MAFNDKEQQVIDWGLKNGKTPEEIQSAVFRLRTTGSPADPQKTTELSPVKEIAIGVAKGAGDSLKFMSDIGQGTARFLTRPIIGSAADQTESQKQFSDTIDSTLKSSNNYQKVGKAVEFGAELFSPFVMSRIASLSARAPSIASKLAPALAETEVGGKVKGLYNAAKEVISNPRLALAKQTANPQLETSAKRLFIEGTERLSDPLKTYDTYISQAKKAANDIKADPPISQVGEYVGDAFRSVVQKRRAVGKTLEEELAKVKDLRTDVLPAIDSFVSTLSKEGLTYDRVSKTITQTARQVKMTAQDQALIEKFAQEFQKLGSKPTIGEIDAFLSRISSDLDIYKSTNNITGVTNGERIIKQTLSSLRSQFDSSTDPALQAYAAARKQYSQLSEFIEEGGRFLGKVTQDGDFSRDASLLKTAVQSVLNNGKKDWLLELERLTGYPALDDSVLALQAMKDVGDFRAASLLETLTQGNVPTSATGISQKVIDYALQKASQVVGGTPEEQTRVFLQALKEGSAKNTPNAAFGAAAGIQPDENGNIDINPADAALGMFGAALGVKGLRADVLKQKRADLMKKVAESSNKIVKAQLMKAVRAIDELLR